MKNLGLVYREKYVQVKVYLRSVKSDNLTARCDIVAEFYGGGGHATASSFIISKNKLKSLIVKWKILCIE